MTLISRSILVFTNCINVQCNAYLRIVPLHACRRATFDADHGKKFALVWNARHDSIECMSRALTWRTTKWYLFLLSWQQDWSYLKFGPMVSTTINSSYRTPRSWSWVQLSMVISLRISSSQIRHVNYWVALSVSCVIVFVQTIGYCCFLLQLPSIGVNCVSHALRTMFFSMQISSFADHSLGYSSPRSSQEKVGSEVEQNLNVGISIFPIQCLEVLVLACSPGQAPRGGILYSQHRYRKLLHALMIRCSTCGWAAHSYGRAVHLAQRKRHFNFLLVDCGLRSGYALRWLRQPQQHDCSILPHKFHITWHHVSLSLGLQFIEDVDAYMAGKDLESTMKMLQDRYQQYKLAEVGSLNWYSTFS